MRPAATIAWRQAASLVCPQARPLVATGLQATGLESTNPAAAPAAHAPTAFAHTLFLPTHLPEPGYLHRDGDGYRLGPSRRS